MIKMLYKNKTIKSPQVRKRRLRIDAKLKAIKHLLESLEVREEMLHKDATLKTTRRLLESPKK